MFTQETTILLRNILLLQLLTVVIIPDYAFAIHKKFLKLWKSITMPLSHKTPPNKRGKFWEIDMSKFEP